MVLEKALHLEAVTRIEEEEKEPGGVALLQPDNTERLISSVNQFVESFSLSRDSRNDIRRGNSE